MSLEFQLGEVHAVIGTNGAGKSTLINMLSGEIPASGGSIHFDGQDITDWPQPKRARAGHRPQLPAHDDLSRVHGGGELPPVRAGRIAARLGGVGTGAALRGQLAVARDRAGRGRARGVAQRGAGTLSHGGKAATEIAMPRHEAARAVARRTAGRHGAEETDCMLALLALPLKATHAVPLVEHDMDAVFRIADRITVMVNGEVIASDALAAIRVNRDADGVSGRGH